MSVWQHVYNLIGKPIITKDKPGAQIEKVLDEIQEKAIVEIEGDEGEAGNTPVRIAVIKDAPNCVKLSGSVNLPASAWQGSEEITFITEVAPSLYDTGTATLGIRLTFTGKKLNLQTGEVTDAEIPAVYDEISGVDCGSL